jgi:hypothetical protein
LILLLAVILAVGVTLYWARQSARGPGGTGTSATGGQPAVTLSESTRAILKRLKSPLEIRFYASLDPASVSEQVRAFAGRIDPLLDAYVQESGGRIIVTRFTSATNFDANAASADGIKPFNIEKGQACFLGLTLELGGHKTTLPQLAPEWEAALEADLSRGISGLLDAQAPPAALATAPTDPAVAEAVKKMFPDLSTVSLEQGRTALRQAALKEFTSVAKEMNRQVQEAQQRYIQAQKGNSDTELQAAQQQLQQAQAEQMRRLDEVTAQAQAQMRAFEKLKAGQ